MEYCIKTEKEVSEKTLSPILLQKYNSLKHYFEKKTKEGICIAYSGGVDSTLLLRAAVDATFSSERRVLAVILETKLHPHSDIMQAMTRAKELHAIPVVIPIDEFQEPEIMNNPLDRCYLCKHLLFSKLKELAVKKGCTFICDGTNKDDEKEYRPGMKVLKELDIHSPLLELGITKAEVRSISAALGLSTAAVPSTPCLATRLPYNTRLDVTLLKRIHMGEEWLRSLGFYNVRLRFHEPLLRIEVDCFDFELLLAHREKIIDKMKTLGFVYITLDLEGFRSGSMDI